MPAILRRPHAAATVDVDIAKFAFGPKEITIAPGTKIVWTNHDETPHTVTSNDKSFASKGLDTDDKFEHTFRHEGDFGYFCTVHPFMTGVVMCASSNPSASGLGQQSNVAMIGACWSGTGALPATSSCYSKRHTTLLAAV